MGFIYKKGVEMETRQLKNVEGPNSAESSAGVGGIAFFAAEPHVIIIFHNMLLYRMVE